jgi:hypothetical protein
VNARTLDSDVRGDLPEAKPIESTLPDSMLGCVHDLLGDFAHRFSPITYL